MPESVTLFAYFDIRQPMVAWEVAIGRVNSAPKREPHGFSTSLWQYSLLRKYAKNGWTDKFASELRLESCRQREFPACVSRLKGQFFFEKYDDAIAALERWKMPERKKYISEIVFYPSALSRHDSEWITHCLGSPTYSWLADYWLGTTYGEKPLTEVLATGRGIILNKDLQKKAYSSILEKWPYSTPMLSAASCAFQFSELKDVGLVVPTLRTWENKLYGDFHIKMEEVKVRESAQIVVEAMKAARAIDFWAPWVGHPDPNVLFHPINLQDQFFEFESSEIVKLFHTIPISDPE